MKYLRLLPILMVSLYILTACKDDPMDIQIDEDRYVKMNNGMNIHYRIIGKKNFTNTMVFIAGWTNPVTVYTKQFDYFRDKALCIYIDVPGQGTSDAPEDVEYTMELMADAIYTVVDKEDITRFTGVGFSFGYSPLTQFERQHQGLIDKMVLLDIGLQTWPPWTTEMREANYETQKAWTKEVKTGMLNVLIPPATAPQDLITFGEYFPDYPSWLLANIFYHFVAEDACQPYQWNIPSMAIYRITTPELETTVDLYFPDCEISVIGGDQHVIQWAYHDVVNPKIWDFVKSP